MAAAGVSRKRYGRSDMKIYNELRTGPLYQLPPCWHPFLLMRLQVPAIQGLRPPNLCVFLQISHLCKLAPRSTRKGLLVRGLSRLQPQKTALLLQPPLPPSAFLALNPLRMLFLPLAGLRHAAAMKVGGDGSPHAGSSASDSVPDSESRLALPDVYDATLIDEARRLVQQQKEQ